MIHVNVWQKPPQYCKVLSLQLKKKKKVSRDIPCPFHSVETQPEAAVYEPEYGQSGLDLGPPSPRTGEQHIYTVYTVCKSPSLWQFVRATLGD